MKNIHYQALQSQARNDSFRAPLSLSLSIYPSVCFLLPDPFSLPFLHFPYFFHFHFFLHSCEVRRLAIYLIHKSSEILLSICQRCVSSLKGRPCEIKWEKCANLEWVSSSRHVFSVLPQLGPWLTRLRLHSRLFKSKRLVYSQSTPVFRVQIGIIPLGIIISSGTVPFPVDVVTACLLPSWPIS